MNIRYLGAASALAMAVSLGMAGMATAQVATSTVRGDVTDSGVGEAGATVVARDVASGFTSRTTANASGGYPVTGPDQARCHGNMSRGLPCAQPGVVALRPVPTRPGSDPDQECPRPAAHARVGAVWAGRVRPSGSGSSAGHCDLARETGGHDCFPRSPALPGSASPKPRESGRPGPWPCCG